MIYRFTFEGNTPSKKNQKRILRRKSGVPFIMPSTEYGAWHKEALWRVHSQMGSGRGVFPLRACSQVTAHLFYADRRRRDASNTFESIMDLLVDAGILADDSWNIVGPTHIYPALRPGRAGWEVAIEA